MGVSGNNLTDARIHDGVTVLKGADGSGYQVGAADKVGHKSLVGIEINLFGVTNLDNFSAAHDRNLV